MDALQTFGEKLKDKDRRVRSGNFYYIKTKEGKRVPFIPNIHQLQFYEAKKHFDLIIIPKARQLGFSTAQQIDMLDSCIWRRNRSGGIIADTKDNAMEIYKDKVKYAWDNFPSEMKIDEKGNFRWITDSDRANQLSFSNTFSKLRVSHNFRGGTYQELHVSEFAKICAERPGDAKEIVTGAFESVATGQKIIIESTSRGNEGYFFDIANRAKIIRDEGRLPQTMEWYLMFFPWWDNPEYTVDINAPIPQELQIYFKTLEDEEGIYLTHGQKMRYTKKKELQNDDIYREYPSTFKECFALIIAGTYYEKELITCRNQKRVCKVPYDPNLEVHTGRDLGGAGGGDDTTIVFFQLYGREVRFIDYREGNGVSLVWVIENVIKKKGYQYGKFFGPHDINVVELAYGESRRDAAKKVGVKFEVIPKTSSLKTDIDMVRNIFTMFWFDESKCSSLLMRLQGYRRKWSELLGIPLDEPMKNGNQHGADAVRTAVMGIFDLMKEDTDAVITSLSWQNTLDNRQ